MDLNNRQDPNLTPKRSLSTAKFGETDHSVSWYKYAHNSTMIQWLISDPGPVFNHCIMVLLSQLNRIGVNPRSDLNFCYLENLKNRNKFKIKKQ